MCHELSVDDVWRATCDRRLHRQIRMRIDWKVWGNCRHIYPSFSFILSVTAAAAATASYACSLPAHRLHICDIWMVHCKTRRTREENIIQFVKIYRQCIRLLRTHRGTLSFSTVDRTVLSLSMYICTYIYTFYLYDDVGGEVCIWTISIMTSLFYRQAGFQRVFDSVIQPKYSTCNAVNNNNLEFWFCVCENVCFFSSFFLLLFLLFIFSRLQFFVQISFLVLVHFL